MAKLTWEQKQARKEAQAEEARQERLTKSLAEFKARVETERAKTVYTDKLGFDDRNAWTLYETVHDYRRVRENLVREIERAQRRLNEALAAANDNQVTYSSSVLNSTSNDIDIAAAEMRMLARSIVRLAYVVGYYVPDIYTARDNESRARLVSLRVVEENGAWQIYSGDRLLLGSDVGLAPVALVYTTEELAWIAAAAWAGFPISTY